MKNAKTVLAFLLALVMLLSVVSTAVYAEDDCEHKWVAGEVVEPTCEKAGYTPYTCSACDATENRDEKEALGHDWDDENAEIDVPTCTQDGLKTIPCKRCEAKKTESLKALGHKWSDKGVVTAPTCTEMGYTTHACERCDATDKRDFVRATGHRAFACSDESTHICTACGTPFAHSFNEWSYDGNNGFFKDGTESRRCCDKGCGYEEHRIVENTNTFHKIVGGATGFGAFLLAAALSPLSWIVKTFNPALHQQIEDAIRELLAQK